MKIVRIIARLNVGGPARHVVWLTDEMRDRGFESLLVAGTVPDGEEDMSYLADEAGIKPFYIKEMSRELSPADIISLWKLYWLFRRESPDIVDTHTAKAGTLGRIAAWFYRWFTPGLFILRPRRVRVIHTFHGHVFHSYYGKTKTNFFIAIEKLLARSATDKIVVVSEQQFREIHKEIGIGDPDQFEIISYGLDLEALSRATKARQTVRAEFGANDDDLLVGFVGRLTEIKNVGLLLKTAKFYKDDPATLPNVKFVIVGDGHLRISLEQEAAELGVTDIVTFAGNRTDIPDVFNALDIVALMSHNEGSPLTLIEAMSCGRPVISRAVGGVVDLLGKPQETAPFYTICERGISIEKNSAESYTQGLKRLIIDKDLRERLSVTAKIHVDEHFSKIRLFNDMDRLYKSLKTEK